MVLLSLTIFLTSVARASNEEEAIRKAGEALYIQSGINKVVEKIDLKYTPEVVKKYGGWIAITQKVIVERQISYKWTW